MEELQLKLPLLGGEFIGATLEEISARTGTNKYSRKSLYGVGGSMNLTFAFANKEHFFMLYIAPGDTVGFIVCYNAKEGNSQGHKPGTFIDRHAPIYYWRRLIKAARQRRRLQKVVYDFAEAIEPFSRTKNFMNMLEASLDLVEKKKPRWLSPELKELKKEIMARARRFKGKVYGREVQI